MTPMMTMVPISSGDEAGILGGVAIPMDMGFSMHTVPKPNVITPLGPAVDDLKDIAIQNGGNTRGMNIPGQFKVFSKN